MDTCTLCLPSTVHAPLIRQAAASPFPSFIFRFFSLPQCSPLPPSHTPGHDKQHLHHLPLPEHPVIFLLSHTHRYAWQSLFHPSIPIFPPFFHTPGHLRQPPSSRFPSIPSFTPHPPKDASGNSRPQIRLGLALRHTGAPHRSTHNVQLITKNGAVSHVMAGSHLSSDSRPR